MQSCRYLECRHLRVRCGWWVRAVGARTASCPPGPGAPARRGEDRKAVCAGRTASGPHWRRSRARRRPSARASPTCRGRRPLSRQASARTIKIKKYKFQVPNVGSFQSSASLQDTSHWRGATTPKPAIVSWVCVRLELMPNRSLPFWWDLTRAPTVTSRMRLGWRFLTRTMGCIMYPKMSLAMWSRKRGAHAIWLVFLVPAIKQTSWMHFQLMRPNKIKSAV